MRIEARYGISFQCPQETAMVLMLSVHPAGPLQLVLKVNGKEVASGVVPVSTPLIFTANDCLDFGIDLGSPVGLEYYDQAPFKFNGKIEGARVQYLSAPAQLQEEKLQTQEGSVTGLNRTANSHRMHGRDCPFMALSRHVRPRSQCPSSGKGR